MNPRLKHRLVGASVLLALAVLILPDVLDGEKVKRQQSFAVIPLQPDFSDAEFRQPKPAKRFETSTSLAAEPDSVASSSPSPEANDSHPVNPTDHKLPQFSSNGWVLQLGVFRNAANVNELLAKIRNAGYPAFSKPKQAIQGKPTWVYVGPNLNKDKLLSFKPELKSLTGLNGKVYPYNPQSQ